MAKASADIGVIGLAVMGRNLVLNMEDHGFTVAVYNRTYKTTDEFLQGDAKGRKIVGAQTLAEFAASLKRPRRALLMVRAGSAVDETVEQLLPHLEPGDIIIDGGNSDFNDTERRVKSLAARGFHFVGMGVSGGEEGARYGPSLMPGGASAAWPHLRDICQAIAAKVDSEPCCDWVGDGGAGHFVKMVHNGIEYADMQLISEAFHLLHKLAGLTYAEMHKLFSEWNRGELESFLIEITAQILTVQDTDGTPLIDKIVDVAGQKGTGKWTVREALEVGAPGTVIAEAVLARFLSGMRDTRQRAAAVFPDPAPRPRDPALPDQVRQALYAAKLVCYAQGYTMFRAASTQYGWKLNNGAIALMWRGGCIIRSRFLGDIKRAFDRNPALELLLLDPFFADQLRTCVPALRAVVAAAALAGVPVPAFSAALAFYDGVRCARLPAALIQAQRDLFGAHTYQRIDAPADQAFHTNWTGRGGSVHAGTYNA